MRSKLPHIDNLSNKHLWNLINIFYSIQWIIFATCLAQNTKIDISMPHWHFVQQLATRGSATWQGNVFCNTLSYISPYILQNNCNHKPTYNKIPSTACYNMRRYNILYFYISMFCTDTCNKQPLGEVPHSVRIILEVWGYILHCSHQTNMCWLHWKLSFWQLPLQPVKKCHQNVDTIVPQRLGCQQPAQIAETHGLTSIIHRSKTFWLDWSLIDVNLSVFAIWLLVSLLLSGSSSHRDKTPCHNSEHWWRYSSPEIQMF